MKTLRKNVVTRSLLLEARNPVIVARYWYWYYIKKRWDALDILSANEFFLSTIRIERIILEHNDSLNNLIKSDKKRIVKTMKNRYPSFDWTATAKELNLKR